MPDGNVAEPLEVEYSQPIRQSSIIWQILAGSGW